MQTEKFFLGIWQGVHTWGRPRAAPSNVDLISFLTRVSSLTDWKDALNTVYFDLRQVFDQAVLDILMNKIVKYGLDVTKLAE